MIYSCICGGALNNLIDSVILDCDLWCGRRYILNNGGAPVLISGMATEYVDSKDYKIYSRNGLLIMATAMKGLWNVKIIEMDNRGQIASSEDKDMVTWESIISQYNIQ